MQTVQLACGCQVEASLSLWWNPCYTHKEDHPAPSHGKEGIVLTESECGCRLLGEFAVQFRRCATHAKAARLEKLLRDLLPHLPPDWRKEAEKLLCE